MRKTKSKKPFSAKWQSYEIFYQIINSGIDTEI